MEKIAFQESALIGRMGERLRKLPGTEVFQAVDPAVQTGVLSFRVQGWDCEDLGEALGNKGIALRAGLH